MKKTVKAVVLIAFVAVCIVGIIALAKNTNNFTDDLKTFYLKIDGDKTFENVSVPLLDDISIEVHDVASDITQKNVDFEYKVVQSGADSWTFQVGNKMVSLRDVTDYTAAFDIVRTDNGIIVKQKNLTDVLAAAFDNDRVFVSDKFTFEVAYFSLVITSGERSIVVDLRLPIYDGVVLDQTEVVF